jgi:hypothetical protein
MKIKFVDIEAHDLKSWCGLRVWEKPKEFHSYAIGVDVAEGVGGDASVAQVLDCTIGKHVACFWSNSIDIDTYSAELYKLGHWYNKAQLCIEQNNHGNGVIAHLGAAAGGLAYPNLYKRRVYDEYTQKQTKQIGFKTTSATKPRIIENLKSALRDGDIITSDKQTILELCNFVRDAKTGKMGASGSGKDDRVIGLALAWEAGRIIKEAAEYTDKERFVQQQYDPMTGFPI